MLDVAESQVDSSKLCVTPNKQQHQAHLAGLKRLSARAASAGALTPPGTRRVVFSFTEYARSVIAKLQSRRVPIADGLTDEEFERIEATYGFTFPPDLRAVLQAGLPVGAGFPNWRAGNPDHLRMRVSLPIAGLLHEVASAAFWWKAWGPRPVDAKQAVRSARCALRRASPLIPLHGHCYLPSSPNLAANPVFFVYQQHVVHCAHDVADFLDREAFLSHKSEFGDLLYDMGSFRNDSSHRASSSSSGTEASADGDSSWGRSLDVLAQKPDHHFLVSPRKPPAPRNGFGRLHSRSASRHLSFDGDPPEFFDDDIMKYSCVVEKALPLQTLMSVAVDDARSPRRIEFWSDLAEKVHKELTASASSTIRPSPVDEARNPCLSPRWLNGYLGELSLILRQGGWREDDIHDMIDTKSTPQHWNSQLDAEGVLVSLAREVELLSSSLKKAGWSVPDVTETMKMGLSALF